VAKNVMDGRREQKNKILTTLKTYWYLYPAIRKDYVFHIRLWMHPLFNNVGVMRINIALPLPRSFKYELDKRTGALRKVLFRSSPHYMWLDKEEWRVSLGFFGKPGDAIDVERVCMAVEQEVFGFGLIIGVTGKFETFQKDCDYYYDCGYGFRNTVGLSFEKGSDRMAELSGRIAEKMNGLLSKKYIQFKSPHITLVRRERRRRPALPVGEVKKLELEPLECSFDKVIVYISDKRISGGVYVLQRSARLI
jgi:2'-5' RNA ligase